MISYAQNHEDVLLQRVFGDLERGFYIDVGAAHPTFDSVTRWFYDCGWCGLNIEPRPEQFRQLAAARLRDINLNVGVSDRPGTLPFFLVNAPSNPAWDIGGISTFDRNLADEYRNRPGFRVEDLACEVLTLGEICRRHHIQQVDFLKIDVEGWEEPVLRGMDFVACRPRVLVIESNVPMQATQAHESWEQQVLDHGYLLAFYDGLNRFYVRQEETRLRERLAVPANVLDNYVPYRLHVAEQQLAHLIRRTDPGSLKVGTWIARRLHRLKRLVRAA